MTKNELLKTFHEVIQKPRNPFLDDWMPIDLSNVMLVCSKCSEAVRVGFRVDGDEKVRVCKNCGEDIK